jgi:GGDEF domain-containing protein
MNGSPGGTARGRQATAAALSVAYLLVGVALAVVATPVENHLRVPALWLVALLVPVYVAAHHYSLDFQLRRESNSITLVQLPLALGLYLISPLAHLGVRLTASLLHSSLDRQGAQKTLFNLAAAAFEVGAAAFAVGLVPDGDTGPTMWLALYLGLLAGDVAGPLVLDAIWRSLGMPVSWRRTSRNIVLMLPVGILFTALAVVAINAARVEPLTTLVMLTLASWLALAYRAHRHVVARQATTEQLYEFVRELGPLTVHSSHTPDVLERVRVLLAAEELELSVPSADDWCHLVVSVDKPPASTVDRVAPLAKQVAATRASELRSRRRDRSDSGSDTMATPLVEDNELIGVLTATHRIGNTRGFDMGDLRLLETIGAELSTALERGRLHEELQLAATTDPLTGLPNLADTTRRLNVLLNLHPEGVLIATVAVDSFREVNDTLGHQVGDELLIEVTRRLNLSVDDALVGRLGGGRFAVALPSRAAGHDAELFGLGLQVQVEQIAPLGRSARTSGCRSAWCTPGPRGRAGHPAAPGGDGDEQRDHRPRRAGPLAAGVRGARASDGSRWWQRCARRSRPAPSAWPTSPRSRRRTAGPAGSRPSPGGRTRPWGPSARTSSCRWPRRPA